MRTILLGIAIATVAIAQVRIPGLGGVSGGGGGSSPAYVDSAAMDNGGFTTTSSGTTTHTINVPSGATIIAYSTWLNPSNLICGGGSSVNTTITRAGGGTFTQIGTYYPDSVGAICESKWILSGASANAADTYVATLTSAELSVSISVIVFTGAATVDANPTPADNASGASTTVVSNSFTTTHASEIIVNAMASYAFGGSWSADTSDGYTLPSNSIAPDVITAMQYKIVSSTQSGVTVTDTKSSSTFIHNSVVSLF